MMKRASILALAGLMLLSLAACNAANKRATQASDQQIPFTGRMPQGPVPSYADVAARHNQRLGRIAQINAIAQVEIIYHDDKGKRRYEQADQCRVMLVRPRQMAVLVRKFGVGDLFLAGSNNERYWLFDLMDNQRRLLYMGRHDADPTQAAQRMPIPVQPRDLPTLMGLMELPAQAEGSSEGSVAAVKGGYLVTAASQDWRMVIAPSTWLPLRVELLDASGSVRVTALLSRESQVETYEMAPGGWPKLMARIEVRPRDSQDKVIVHLSSINDGREDDAIDAKAFDLTRLQRIYKPDEVIDLDRP